MQFVLCNSYVVAVVVAIVLAVRDVCWVCLGCVVVCVVVDF